VTKPPMTLPRKSTAKRHKWEFVPIDEGHNTERCDRCGLERTTADDNCTRFSYHFDGKALGSKLPRACGIRSK